MALETLAMRFWASFHRYSLEIVADSENKLTFRAPNCVRLHMTVDHLESNQESGSCFTQFNHDTFLWECYHSPCTNGQHRRFLWLFDCDADNPWTLAARFDILVKQTPYPLYYPVTTNLFNELRCQLIKPMNDTLLRSSLPSDIVIRVPHVHAVQLHVDESTVIEGIHLRNDIYSMQTPSNISNRVKYFLVMGLCIDSTYYSLLITYKIE